MESRYVFILISLLSLFDLIAVNCAYLVVWFAYSLYSNYPIFNYYFIVLINISWSISVLLNKVYKYKVVQTLDKLLYKSTLTYSLQVLFISLCVAKIKIFNVTDEFLFYYLMVLMVGLLLIRLIIYIAQNKVNKLNSFRKNIAIVGYSEVSDKLADFFRQNKLSYNFAGYYKRITKQNAVAKIDELKKSVQYAVDNKLDEVYTTLFPEECHGLAQVIKLAEQNCLRVKYITTTSDYKRKVSNQYGGSYNLNGYHNGVPILVNRPEPLSLLRNRIIKRGFDIAFSLAVIVFLLSWLIPIIGLLIKLESRGPVIFMQLRSGRNNRPFWCYKFRSMRANKNSDTQQATKNDMRVTKIGAFLRKTSIDELPQFFNVLLGNMSIVGPRPHMIKHTDEYRNLIDQYMVRLFLKPGITGWAQINGYRGETINNDQMRMRVEHDIWYMENWSITQDVLIIYQTVINAATGEANAY